MHQSWAKALGRAVSIYHKIKSAPDDLLTVKICLEKIKSGSDDLERLKINHIIIFHTSGKDYLIPAFHSSVRLSVESDYGSVVGLVILRGDAPLETHLKVVDGTDRGQQSAEGI